MIATYSTTIFISAFLIFLVQPMVAKALLPYLGGVPAVWNTSMVFYQFMLLGGYVYAHLGVRLMGVKRQAVLHIILLFFSLAALPIALRTGIDISSSQYPVSWVLSVLLISVGLPFFLLSANAPLLQSWLSHTTHKSAKNPYFLYSTSNLGSLIALLGYPLLFEPFFNTSSQMNWWSGFYVVLTLMLAACAGYLYKYYIKNKKAALKKTKKENAPDILTKLRWIGLAFVPSSLMLGITTYITTDIASIPLFWVIPLAIYLLSFVFAFMPNTPIYERSLNAHISLVMAVVVLLIFYKIQIATGLALPLLIMHLFMFFAVAMVCHGQLAKTKPDTKYLTEFYLLISVGGVLGGAFNSLLAPLIFNSVIEYQIIIIVSCFFRPMLQKYKNEKKERVLDVLLPVVLGTLLYLYFNSYEYISEMFSESIKAFDDFAAKITENVKFVSLWSAIFMIIVVYACYKFHKRPVRFGLGMGVLLMITPIAKGVHDSVVDRERNFFGALRIEYEEKQNFYSLFHGTTLHGIQTASGPQSLKPTTYYAPLGDIFPYLDGTNSSAPVAIVGLGVGTTACYGKKGQKFDFFEINESVERIARNRDYFTYMSDCLPDISVTIGDGRIELEKKPDKTYGLVIMDAFSSDSIPMHLLTEEAINMYLAKLRNNGILAFHVSNRYFDLTKILESIARKNGLFVVQKHFIIDRSEKYEEANSLLTDSYWAVIAKNDKLTGRLVLERGWEKPEKSDTIVWTDNYSNLLSVLK